MPTSPHPHGIDYADVGRGDHTPPPETAQIYSIKLRLLPQEVLQAALPQHPDAVFCQQLCRRPIAVHQGL